MILETTTMNEKQAMKAIAESSGGIRYLEDELGNRTDVVVPMTIWYQILDKFLPNYIEVVERTGGLCPLIKGTRIGVSDVIGYLKIGETPETLVTKVLPMLTHTQINAALFYYQVHKDEIDKLLEQNTEAWGRQILRESLGDQGYRAITGEKVSV